MSTNASGSMTLDEIKECIPHREPMLMLDEVLERSEGHIICRRTIRADEFFLQGHYPNYPLVPGVILCEAAMQAGAVLMSTLVPGDGVPVAARLNDVKFRRKVFPGDTIEIHVSVQDNAAQAVFMKAKVMLDNAVAMRCDFACVMAAPDA